MLVVVGLLVVVGAVLTGFSMGGGHIASLIHPSEVITIGGATLGAMIVMSSRKVLFDVFHGIVVTFKGSPYDRRMYSEFLKASYELLCLIRREGLLNLESHVIEPQSSHIFAKYPRFNKNKHALEFFCNGLIPTLEGGVEAEDIKLLLDAEIQVLNEEHHSAVGVLQKAADALPGFGIVAAVLGIVITMGSIDGPVEEIGHKVGTALVGTFLGILMSYGFFGPLAAKMEHLGAAELAFFRTMSAVILSASRCTSPKIAIEQACRGIGTECRPHRDELEAMLKEIDKGATSAGAA